MSSSQPVDPARDPQALVDGRGVMATVVDPAVTPSPDAGAEPAPDGAFGRAGRNLLFEEIGRGGMGLVLRGHDPELGRDLAVKLLRPDRQGEPGPERRFVEEARIAGQLQHPAIAPVYEMGRCGDGRPYFAMKLIRGHNLAGLLAARPDPGHDLPRFLGIFEQVCQALAYAHSKGVIHRDLKPLNIMVGAFGEVQVMDWGLAKVLGRSEREGLAQPDTETVIRTSRSDSTSGDEEPTGVVGTPAFMAPEQARGEVECVDERADVFGLGALLCVLLTGKPPHTAERTNDALRAAAGGDLSAAFARLEGSPVDAELVALARDCLAPRREDRPRDADAVAKRMAAYLAGVQERLRQAGLERAAAEARAEEAAAKAALERQARRLTMGLAAALVGLLLLAGGGGLYLDRQRELRQRQAAQRQAGQNAAADAALEKAAELRRQERWTETQALLGQALRLLGEDAPEPARARLEQAVADAVLVGELDAVRQKMATLVEGRFDLPSVDREYAEVFRRRGLAVEGEDPEAVARRVSDSAVKAPLLAALDDWTFATRGERRRAWLLEVTRRVDPRPWRDRLRDPELWRIPNRLPAVAGRVKPEEISLQTAVALGWRLEADQALTLLRNVQRRHPDDFWVNLALGTRLLQTKKEEALRYLHVAVALRPTAAVAHYNLGFTLQGSGLIEEALSCYRRALDIDPRYTQAHNNLGKVLKDSGKVDEVLACWRRAIEVDPRHVPALVNLGTTWIDQGKVDKGIPYIRKAVQIDPQSAAAHTCLGVALKEIGRLDEAIASHRRGLQCDPLLAVAHNNLGVALKEKGKVDEAILCYRKAIDLDPRYGAARNNLGVALMEKGKAGEAIACYRKAIDLDPRYSQAHYNLGQVLKDRKEADAAMASFRRAIALDGRLAPAHHNLGELLYFAGKVDEAMACLRRAIEHDPRCAHSHYLLGVACYSKGNLAEAIVCFRKTIAIDPRLAPAHSSLGAALKDSGKLDEAIACQRKAIALAPRFAQAHGALALALRDRGHFAEARDATARALELMPAGSPLRQLAARQLEECRQLVKREEKLTRVLRGEAAAGASEMLELAWVCRRKQLHASAARLAAEAFALEPSLAGQVRAGYRFDAARAAALAGCGKGEDAGTLSASERQALRRRALTWLRAELAQFARLVERGEVGRSRLARTLATWRQDPELACVREPAALGRLEVQERQEWRRLWREVEALPGKRAKKE